MEFTKIGKWLVRTSDIDAIKLGSQNNMVLLVKNEALLHVEFDTQEDAQLCYDRLCKQLAGD